MENKEKRNENNKKNKIKFWITFLAFIAIIVVVIIAFAKVFNNDNCENNTLKNNPNNEFLENPMMTVDKPIIYLYPEKEQEISVKLGKPENIICSYPEYKTEWNVISKPNGDLIDLDTNRNLYALYYESKNVVDFKVEEDGFIVNKTDVASFLEEKLNVLGLNEREAEEFIVYWLPRLQQNEYNYIRFATTDEVNKNMPLEFSENLDTLIRVLMIYKGIEEPIKVKEQKLTSPKRTGFVVVEWGGSEIK
ncbi:MAG: hypothetical protein V8R39_07405 [Clostridia bacterium]